VTGDGILCEKRLLSNGDDPAFARFVKGKFDEDAAVPRLQQGADAAGDRFFEIEPHFVNCAVQKAQAVVFG